VVEAWDAFLRSQASEDTRWYPPVVSRWGEQSLVTDALPGKNRHQALVKRLRILFETAGLEFKSAHKFRHGHAVYGLQNAPTMADYKAVSMNLMHQDIKITDQIYTPILSEEVSRRIAGLGTQPEARQEDALNKYMQSLSNSQLSQVMLILAERLNKE
jgi:integrase